MRMKTITLIMDNTKPKGQTRNENITTLLNNLMLTTTDIFRHDLQICK